jgi:XTP/dITP diphosphohydrolase
LELAEILLIGSGNRDKAKELAELLSGLPWDVKCLADYPEVEEVEETGTTFEENALLKAQYYSKHFGVACVADDSGLEVDYLNGAPGVYSARYAGEDCTYSDNNKKLLKALEEAPWHERTARFVCVAAFVSLDGKTHTVRGACEGYIAAEPFGKNGFGYDPVFVPKNCEQTFAEMSATEKHKLSHRGAAFNKMRAYLESLA